MNKNNLFKVIIFFLVCLAYTVFGKIFNVYLPCIMYELTGLYCPGCGITRMCLAILKFNFYEAFRYNMLVFILSPFFIVLLINYFYCFIFEKEYLYKRVPKIVWYIILVALILFGIFRNIFPFLAPTAI